MSRDVLVFVGLPNGRTVHAGDLSFQTNPGGALISTRFRHTDAWLAEQRRIWNDRTDRLERFVTEHSSKETPK